MSDESNTGDNGDTPERGGPGGTGISAVSIRTEMEKSFLGYAMSVIVSRALPDARDGLKPVHRRILYTMHENSYFWNRAYKKSSRVVGDVMGKYHPHGDSAIYDALVRMAQPFSLRVMLVDGQGNFGSVDGDAPAAMRYTEVRLQKVTDALLQDIDKDTVDFQDNYDGSEREPVVLPARFPNLLVNGAGGIAVGMATNIPPHNLGEIVDATIALIDDPALTITDLNEIVPGPDFPTGGIILGRSGIRSCYEVGRGSILMRAKVRVEPMAREREALIVDEIPYQVNKAALVEKIAELVRDKRVEGISDLRDESDRDGMRVVIELKRDANSDVVLNQLYRFSPLQTSFGANMVALNGGRPEQLNLKDLLSAFIAFREEVIARRTKYLLAKARDRAHVLVGLAVAVANIDEVIRLIRAAPNPGAAREQLMERDWAAQEMAPLIALIDDPRHRLSEDGTIRLSEEQARAILALQLSRLTALGRDEIGDELKTLADEIADYLDILRSRVRVQQIIKDELIAVRDEFATPRKTEIAEGGPDLEDEDFINREDMVVTVSHAGYIKRVPLDTYRAQRRGGKGRAGTSLRDEDFVTRLFVANTHTPVLFFSSRGMVYKQKVWRLPIGGPQSRGKALVNILPLQDGERITSILPLVEDEESWGDFDVMFATDFGNVRRNKLSDFTNVNRAGKIAMKLDEGDGIVGVHIATPQDDVLLTTAKGQAIRFAVSSLRVFAGRTSTGVRGISLGKGDRVISMAVLRHFETNPDERSEYLRRRRAIAGEVGAGDADESTTPVQLDQERYAEMSAAEQHIITISANGYGKRTSAFGVRVTARGGKGVTAMVVNDRNGDLVASMPVDETDQLMLVTNKGQLIRIPVDGVRVAGRATQGVIVFNTADDENVVSVERVSEEDDDPVVEE